ncbi:Uncharacterised protein [Enterobacter hormaechei]|jgi:hypothetical protein|nr:Uncharacterised protein [Enterobacter hormaechei]CZY79074.1 Uncharacterised protein [Enterobacter hormaechei]CZY80147.1 Uncharacterised protein [Enterobacter hormaechei]SAF27019.1 Uncharacterised protein [Enterobacter hormaechei]
MNVGTLGVYVATRPSEAHIGQFLLSSGVAFTSRLPCVKTVQQLRLAFVGSDISYVRYPTFIRYFRLNRRWSQLVSRYWLHLYELVGFAPRPLPLSRHASSGTSHGESRIVARDLAGLFIHRELQSIYRPVYNVNYSAPKLDNMFYRQTSQNIGCGF